MGRSTVSTKHSKQCNVNMFICLAFATFSGSGRSRCLNKVFISFVCLPLLLNIFRSVISRRFSVQSSLDDVVHFFTSSCRSAKVGGDHISGDKGAFSVSDSSSELTVSKRVLRRLRGADVCAMGATEGLGARGG